MAGERKNKEAAAEAVARPSASARRHESAHSKSRRHISQSHSHSNNNKNDNNSSKIVTFKLPQQAVDRRQSKQDKQQEKAEQHSKHRHQSELELELPTQEQLSEQHLRERQQWLDQHQMLLEQQEKLLKELRAHQQEQQQQLSDQRNENAMPKVASDDVAAAPPVDDELQKQLAHLAQLSDTDFERDFRQWMAQEGVAHNMQAHLRVELINSFNKTPLGQQLYAMGAAQRSGLMLSPLALALHTLVAEFLHEQNCHYTLSVYCSEMPYHHALPDFAKRSSFRFNDAELQNVMVAALSMETQSEALKPLQERVLQLYNDNHSLLFSLLKVLVEGQRRSQLLSVTHAGTMTATEAPARKSCRSRRTQTQPTACLTSRLNINYSQLLQVDCANDDVVAGLDGQTVFVGPRICQALRHVERQLTLLVRQTHKFAKSCAPPVEVISRPSFEQLLQLELRERQRLKGLGEPMSRNQLALPTLVPAPPAPVVRQPSIVETPLGPIKVPALSENVPAKPALHPEQLGSLAMVRQVLDQLQLRLQHPQGKIHSSLERVESLMGEICVCVQALGNVLNLAMEQEHSVGCHKGFKQGYKEGFTHGHFVGIQEGEQLAKAKRNSGELLIEVATQTQVEAGPKLWQQRHMETNTQSELPQQPALLRNAATNTRRKPRPALHNMATSTEQRTMCDAHMQTQEDPPAEKTYEQWIYEMLHSHSGQVFLERVELSLNKALGMQKKRLDDLYDIKLRHQTEMLRINQRQCSWRALCRRVERDSSGEARELVHKIFGLLEHYEHNNQALIEKIQQTELAAEQFTHVMPVWDDTMLSSMLPTSAPTSGSSTPMPEDAWDMHRRQQQKKAMRQPKPQVQPINLFSQQFQLPLTTSPQYQPLPPPPAMPMESQLFQPTPMASQQYQLPPPAVPMASQLFQAPPAVVHPSQFYQPLPAAVAPPEQTAAKPVTSSVATNTVCHAATSPIVPTAPMPIPHHTAPSPQPEQVFNDALLSAKNRMTKLEEESELLERSFRSYFERTRVQKNVCEKVTRKIRERCARECQQINEKLDSCRSWHQCYDNDHTDLPEHDRLTSTHLDDECCELLDNFEKLSDAEDSFEFTNAIAVARSKLLGDLNFHTTTAPDKDNGRLFAGMIKTDKLPQPSGPANETEKLLSQVKATMMRAVATARPHIRADLAGTTGTEHEKKHWIERAKWAIEQPLPNQADLMAAVLERSNVGSASASASDSVSICSLPKVDRPLGDWQHVGGGDSLPTYSQLTSSPISLTLTAAVPRQPETGAGDGSASSMADEEAVTPASRKLQRSMAKMQQLFAAPSAFDTATPSRNTYSRPMSAPISRSVLDLLPKQPKRPHTAPSYNSFLQLNRPSPVLLPAQSLQDYIDDMSASDTYSNCSKRSMLDELETTQDAYAQLASTSTRAMLESRSYQSSPELCDSQEFWKRLNL